MYKVHHVVIMICTRGRPATRRKCISSLGKLVVPDNIKLSVIVGDNNEASAYKDIASELAVTELSYNIIHENKPGYCYIRNRVLCAALESNAEILIFIDDDHAVEPDLITNYLMVFQTFKADVVHGFYIGSSRKYREGQRAEKVATYNVAFRNWLIADTCIGGLGLRFDTRLNLVGREDIEFFRDAAAQGAKLIYSERPKTRQIEPQKLLTASTSVPLTAAYAEGCNAIYVERIMRGFASALQLFAKSYMTKGMRGFLLGCIVASPKAHWNLASAHGAWQGLWTPGIDRSAAKQGKIVPISNEMKMT